MTDYEFTAQMNRIRDVFGKAQYSEERIKIIWKIARDIDEDSFEKICTHFIGSFKGPPLPQDFIQAIYADRKAKGSARAAQEELGRNHEEAKIECNLCFETGLIFTKEDSVKTQVLMRCTCGFGENRLAEFIPQWSPEIGGLFVRQEFPVKHFVPPRSEEPLVMGGQFSPHVQSLIDRWQAKVKFSEDFWKHQIETHRNNKT